MYVHDMYECMLYVCCMMYVCMYQVCNVCNHHDGRSSQIMFLFLCALCITIHFGGSTVDK